jgi:hypothetical protein
MPTAESSGYLGPEDFGAYGREVHAAFKRLFGVSWEEPSHARSLCRGRPPLCPSAAEGEAVKILHCAYALRARIAALLARQGFPRERWAYLERLMRDLLVHNTFTHPAGVVGVAVHMEAPIFALRRESEGTLLAAERRRLVLFLASRFPGLLGRWLPGPAKLRGVNNALPGASRIAGLTGVPAHSPSAPTVASEDSRRAGGCDRPPVSLEGSRKGASQNEPNVLLRGIAAGLVLGRWIPKERMRTEATGAVRFQKVVTTVSQDLVRLARQGYIAIGEPSGLLPPIMPPAAHGRRRRRKQVVQGSAFVVDLPPPTPLLQSLVVNHDRSVDMAYAEGEPPKAPLTGGAQRRKGAERTPQGKSNSAKASRARRRP